MAQTDSSTAGIEAASDDSSRPRLPPPPNPSADPILSFSSNQKSGITSPSLIAQIDDIFDVTPLTALRLFGAGLKSLVEITGDIPPTPPPRSPTIPNMRGMEAEKKSIVRSNSEKNLARLVQPVISGPPPWTHNKQPAGQRPQEQSVDGVHLRTPNPTPPPDAESQPHTPLEPYIIINENSQPINVQHSAIIRKFYSKLPPPISITDYLLRIHQFCPMSTAVYLATSFYIHRLAVVERAIPVTKRNAHRLLLAGLRVAMKATEDMSYPHHKIAMVGGVGERELARLEISFCFLMSFELFVGEELLQQHWELLKRGREMWELSDRSHGGTVLSMPHPPSRATASASAGS
ncbi:cyclin-domain-containing protein [Podospora aff. communis PSN243]|uniref:Cyclin-domain-containing protein n=1 Tax=Podospora aff. communis PSN243 TaxID=3040156 RepID=A0AAV9GU03_9PEZI|nr:cyclin-domain-containing protein [Podospora aff. communis PSN243]